MERRVEFFVNMPVSKRNALRKRVAPYVDLQEALVQWQESIERSSVVGHKDKGKHGVILTTTKVDAKIMELKAMIDQIVHSAVSGKEWVSDEKVERLQRVGSYVGMKSRVVTQCEKCGEEVFAKFYGDNICHRCEPKSK